LIYSLLQACPFSTEIWKKRLDELSNQKNL
jgi:hypothetical protein